MAKNNLKFVLLIALLLALIVGCKKEDTEKPVITISSPTEASSYKQGETINVVGKITDNENLKQYKIDFHIGNGHSHGKMQTTTADFEFEDIRDIEGKTYDLNLNITLPDNVTVGEYHLIIDATDQSGNLAKQVEVEVNVALK